MGERCNKLHQDGTRFIGQSKINHLVNMAPPAKTAIKIVFGAMTIGKPGVEQTRVHTLEGAAALLDVFQQYGHSEVDTARVYGDGSSEEYLGQLAWQKRGLVVETKLYPIVGTASHKPEDLRKHLMLSLKALEADKIDLWYLHAPDRNTPYEETLREVNNLHKEGFFNRFGISNYMAWEVAQVCEICDRNGWIKPTVYQGLYNAIDRSVELELFPCLRHYGIAFYAYNPLAGGYLTSRYRRDTTEDAIEKGSRFDPSTQQGRRYRARYWKEDMFDALDILRPVAEKHELTEAECALRWMMHNSLLNREHGDALIIGASSTGHLEENLKDLEKGPLPEEVLNALDQAWSRTRATTGKYFH